MGYTTNEIIQAAGPRRTRSISNTTLTTLVNVFASGLKGLVPAPDSGGADSAKFLRGDATWQTVITSLANLNASNLTSGTIPDARFPATLPAISGANLTNLDATDLTGTIADARLSANVALLDALNIFSQNTEVQGVLSVFETITLQSASSFIKDATGHVHMTVIDAGGTFLAAFNANKIEINQNETVFLDPVVLNNLMDNLLTTRMDINATQPTKLYDENGQEALSLGSAANTLGSISATAQLIGLGVELKDENSTTRIQISDYATNTTTILDNTGYARLYISGVETILRDEFDVARLELDYANDRFIVYDATGTVQMSLSEAQNTIGDMATVCEVKSFNLGIKAGQFTIRDSSDNVRLSVSDGTEIILRDTTGLPIVSVGTNALGFFGTGATLQPTGVNDLATVIAAGITLGLWTA